MLKRVENIDVITPHNESSNYDLGSKIAGIGEFVSVLFFVVILPIGFLIGFTIALITL